jgi:hypothetical protein
MLSSGKRKKRSASTQKSTKKKKIFTFTAQSTLSLLKTIKTKKKRRTLAAVKIRKAASKLRLKNQLF